MGDCRRINTIGELIENGNNYCRVREVLQQVLGNSFDAC